MDTKEPKYSKNGKYVKMHSIFKSALLRPYVIFVDLTQNNNWTQHHRHPVLKMNYFILFVANQIPHIASVLSSIPTKLIHQLEY